MVTLLSPDGAFGGPVRVAVNLAHELTARGVDVTIAAGARGFDQPVSRYEGIEAITAPVRRLVPRAGFSGLVSSALIRKLAVRLDRFDVIHVHLSRDLVTMPVALMALAMGKAMVVQTHGMIDPSTRRLAQTVDLLATRRVLRRADAVLYLTDAERELLVEVVGDASLKMFRLPNGVPQPEQPVASGDDGTVLFASRLHARKQPTLFVRAAAEVVKTRPQVRFVMAGPDEGELAGVVQLIDGLGLSSSISYVGPLAHADLLERLRRAAVYVLPSVDEPYPMTVLEAMSVGTPVIVTDSCGLANEVTSAGAGFVVQPSVTSVAHAVSALVQNDDYRRRSGLAAAMCARDKFGIAGVADNLMSIYDDATARIGGSSRLKTRGIIGGQK